MCIRDRRTRTRRGRLAIVRAVTRLSMIDYEPIAQLAIRLSIMIMSFRLAPEADRLSITDYEVAALVRNSQIARASVCTARTQRPRYIYVYTHAIMDYDYDRTGGARRRNRFSIFDYEGQSMIRISIIDFDYGS